jgi:hypothetical protein
MSAEKEIAIKKLSKRILNLVQELELASLDISQNSIPLSKGLFPNTWAKETNKAFNHWVTELQRITNNWNELFKEQIEAPEEPKPVVKITRRKK